MGGKKLIIIGAGFSGISASCFMAKAGWDVTVLEKHHIPGGRARKFTEQGFTFDMGPSWYWMPDVFENFFKSFNKTVSSYYHLDRLNPSYKIYWPAEVVNIPADFNALKDLFDKTEPGAGTMLEKFIEEAAYKYKVGMQKLVFKPGLSIKEFYDTDLFKGLLKLDVFTSMKTHVAKYFSNEKLRQLLEFPVLFLGALPEKIPALYSLMNYADIIGGTWFPKGGMYSIVDGMYKLAQELGVKFLFNKNVTEIAIENNKVKYVEASIEKFYGDVVISAADYHFTETELLKPEFRNYSENWWSKKTMAPSCLLYYLGINKKLKNVLHHSLFFDTSFFVHGNEIYTSKQWPSQPLFYVSATSVTDETLAPPGCENLFFLIPVSAGLDGDNDELREKYFDMIIERFEKRTGEEIKKHIIYKKSYAQSNFINDYGAYKGNAYGLANTLLQTANLKPSIKNKKVDNLFYTGQLTVPGPGVPPCIISGEVVATQILKKFN